MVVVCDDDVFTAAPDLVSPPLAATSPGKVGDGGVEDDDDDNGCDDDIDEEEEEDEDAVVCDCDDGLGRGGIGETTL